MSLNSFLGRKEIINILLSNQKTNYLIDSKTKVLLHILGPLALRILGFPININARNRANDILNQVKKLPKGKIIDIGSSCGYTHTFELAKIANPYQVLGLDIDPISIDVAIRINKVLGFENLNFQIADITKDLDQREMFQIAFSTETLEHLEDDIQALMNISKLINSGGWLVLSMPYSENPVEYCESVSTLSSKLEPGMGENLFVGERHWRSGYNHISLRSKLESAGFIVKKISYSFANHILPDKPIFFPINLFASKIIPNSKKNPSKINAVAQKS
jgi:2-polyprenyl-3-methyl-5-hydroxy-6-metoxy-1,4-benzoquinol methylase